MEEDHRKEHMLETLELNLLIFLKKSDDSGIFDSLIDILLYLVQKQEKLFNQTLVRKIYLEEWVHKLVPHEILQNKFSEIEIWQIDQLSRGQAKDQVVPADEAEDSPENLKVISNMNENRQRDIHMDYIITIGGDGTILKLLSEIRDYEKYRHLPPIIAFSSVSYYSYW